MIDETLQIIPGLNVRHDEGFLYRVDEMRQSTNGYESTYELGSMVVGYTQLEDGGFPAGTKWSKDEAEFRQFFTPTGSAE